MKGEVGGGVVQFGFISHSPTLSGNQINIPQVGSVLPVIGNQFLPVLVSTQKLFVTFSLLHPAEESNDRGIGGHLESSHGKSNTLRQSCLGNNT